MTRRQQDDVDVLAIEWARQRRMIFGIREGRKLQPRDRLGKLRCTLGQLQDEAVSAGERTTKMGENGHANQNWPEVYRGMALELHRCYQQLPSLQKIVMDLHYVWREVPVARKCREHRVKVHLYWPAVEALKKSIRSYLRGGGNYVEQVGARGVCFGALQDTVLH